MSAGRIKFGASVAVATLVIASTAVAQQATQPRLQERQSAQPGQAGERDVEIQIERGQAADRAQQQQRTAGYRAGGQAGQSQQVDKFLATCLLIKNQGEIKMNQFGQQQAENPQVKQFAQQMVQDHQQLVQKLEQVAGQQSGGQQASRQSVGATGQSDTQRTATNTQSSAQQNSAAQSQASSSGGSSNQLLQQLASIDREITERCGELTKQKLQEKQGQQFDKAFMGCQVAAHIDMLAALQVTQQQATGELAQIAQQAEQKVQQHLEQAEQIMKQLDSRQARATQ